jgi:hypothetical protein
MRKVWVKWLDAVVETNEHWVWRREFQPREAGGLECESMGFVVHEDEQSIVLAQSFNDACIDNILTLPMGMVLSIKELKPSKR